MTKRGLFRACCAGAILFSITRLSGQQFARTSIPLSTALHHALDLASLVGPNAEPFHIRVHLSESTNTSSPYQAEIEEYWVSSKQWRRSIDTPNFKQILIVNGDQISEHDTGDYYSLWLRTFVTAVFDLIPDADRWTKIDAQVIQVTRPDGGVSDGCVRNTEKIGSGKTKNDAFSTICFDGKQSLKYVVSPGYAMQFRDYRPFGKLLVARRYENDPEPGTHLVASVVALEELKKSDSTLFSVAQPAPEGQRLESVRVNQDEIEKASAGQSTLSWPPVTDGKTTGMLSMYISVDRKGQVREAYPLNSDNAQLQDAARDQLLKWKIKPITVSGSPSQAEAALTFHFQTTLTH